MTTPTTSIVKKTLRPLNPKIGVMWFVQKVMTSFIQRSGLDRTLVSQSWNKDPSTGIKITTALKGTVRFELPIDTRHTNRLNILHGGTIAALTDLGGSLAVASQGYFNTGVSTDIHVSYVRSGGTIGDKIRAHAHCDKIGKSLAYTKVVFKNEKDEVVARGSHTKYVKDAVKAQEKLGGLYEVDKESFNRRKGVSGQKDDKVKATEESAVGKSATQEPATEKPAAEKPVTETTAEESAVEKPGTKEMSTEGPVSEEGKAEDVSEATPKTDKAE